MVSRSKFKRHDSRQFDQLRDVSLQSGISRYAEGSCFIKMGHTHVMCLASVEEDLPEWRAEKGLGWVTGEYAMIPRATHTRTRRESVKGKISGRTSEISRLVGRSLRAVVDFAKLGPRTITVDCEVLQADGGTRCAAITGGYVALEQACHTLKKEGLIKDWPLADSVAAVSVGMVKENL
ncbi:MAG: ribonuclease PH, partial [bacterium]|nr:ribonuclease PH [bacterium]